MPSEFEVAKSEEPHTIAEESKTFYKVHQSLQRHTLPVIFIIFLHSACSSSDHGRWKGGP